MTDQQTDQQWLAERFEAKRPHLRAVALRMLGSPSEADDALQETWIKLSRADSGTHEVRLLCVAITCLGIC